MTHEDKTRHEGAHMGGLERGQGCTEEPRAVTGFGAWVRFQPRTALRARRDQDAMPTPEATTEAASFCVGNNLCNRFIQAAYPSIPNVNSNPEYGCDLGHRQLTAGGSRSTSGSGSRRSC